MLTQAEHDNIKAVADQARVLQVQTTKLFGLLSRLQARTDPADPLAANETWVSVVAAYSPLYAAMKADIQTAYTAMP